MRTSEAQYILNHFNLYYRNRLINAGNKLESKKAQLKEENFRNENPMKPTLNDKSAKMAHNYRVKQALKLGINPDEVDIDTLDRMDFLRA